MAAVDRAGAAGKSRAVGGVRSLALPPERPSVLAGKLGRRRVGTRGPRCCEASLPGQELEESEARTPGTAGAPLVSQPPSSLTCKIMLFLILYLPKCLLFSFFQNPIFL